jgi:diguanylate cyclase (GGDEF)-like protein
LATMACTTIGAAGGSAASNVITQTVAACLVLTVFRVFAARVVHSFARDVRFAAISEVAATVDSLEDGWRLALPLIVGYLEGSDVTIVERQGEVLVPIAGWPADRVSDLADAEHHACVEAALVTGAPVVETYRVAIPVTGDLPLVALVTGTRVLPVSGMYHEYRCAQVGLQLRVLVNRVQMIQGLEQLTRTDSLTGLPNRRALMERLVHEGRLASRSGQPLCAVMIDLDHFKNYNDQYGHLEGDRALQEVAALMMSRLRATDLACRFGGEEFSMVLPQTELAGALALVDEVRAATPELALRCPLTISAGVAQWNGTESPEALLDRADHALYLAKAAGRNQCRLSDTARVASNGQAAANLTAIV